MRYAIIIEKGPTSHGEYVPEWMNAPADAVSALRVASRLTTYSPPFMAGRRGAGVESIPACGRGCPG